ncbi:tetratricopeptide repeat protein [Kitasatospora sp. NPDC004723]|uniref:tetratricopeptide repeat protein n=1 Tax=Kitasatospora sp. NPDC004723 TaxID=3154288 RepID=UPI0033BC32A2
MSESTAAVGAGVPPINFVMHQARTGSMGGAREDFETMIGLLAAATTPNVRNIAANPGDWGIDAFAGDLGDAVTIWQSKYFWPITEGGTHQQAIRESFESAVRAAAEHGYAVANWILCIPSSMDGATAKWWDAWKKRKEKEQGVVIELWDETALRQRLHTPEADDVRRAYYEPLHGKSPTDCGTSCLRDLSRWPLVKHWDVLQAGVHRVRRGGNGDRVTPYVARDIDECLKLRISEAAVQGGLVLVVGDSTAGKTRAAFEAVRAVLPEHRVLSPESGSDLQSMVEVLEGTSDPCVVWLDDLELYLGPEALTPALLARFTRSRTPVVATMRSSQYLLLNSFADADGAMAARASNQAVAAAAARVLNLAESVDLNRLWSEVELAHAAQSTDSRVLEAVEHHSPYGVAEYLAAGPALLQGWRRSWRAGAHPRSASIVAAAVDLSRTGMRGPFTEGQLKELHDIYLAREGGPVLRPESWSDAMAWATKVHYGVTSLLIPSTDGAWRVFDYLADHTTSEIPAQAWDFALENSHSPADRYTIGVNAYRPAPAVAERVWRELADRGVVEAMHSLGVLRLNAGDDGDEAEQWFRRAVDAGHLMAANNLGIVLVRSGRSEEAEAMFRLAMAVDRGLASQSLATLLVETGRRDEAEGYYQQAIESGHSAAAIGYGKMLAEDGHLAEAEVLFRFAIEDHPGPAMMNLGCVLAAVGRLEDAEHTLTQALESGHTKAAAPLYQLYSAAGRWAEAEELAEQAAEAGNPEAALGLGLALIEEGEPDRAERILRRAAESGLITAAVSLGLLLRRQGRAPEAAEMLAGSLSQLTSGKARQYADFLAEWGRQDLAEVVIGHVDGRDR